MDRIYCCLCNRAVCSQTDLFILPSPVIMPLNTKEDFTVVGVMKET